MEEKKKGISPILIVILSIVVTCLIIFGIYYAVNHSKEESNIIHDSQTIDNHESKVTHNSDEFILDRWNIEYSGNIMKIPYTKYLKSNELINKIKVEVSEVKGDSFEYSNGLLTVTEVIYGIDEKYTYKYKFTGINENVKEALITDGVPSYPEIIDKIGIKHQLCIFHIIKNHHSKTYKPIRRISKRIKTITNTIPKNKTTIETLKEQNRNGCIPDKKKKKNRKRIKKLEKENKALRTERTKKN